MQVGSPGRDRVCKRLESNTQPSPTGPRNGGIKHWKVTYTPSLPPLLPTSSLVCLEVDRGTSPKATIPAACASGQAQLCLPTPVGKVWGSVLQYQPGGQCFFITLVTFQLFFTSECTEPFLFGLHQDISNQTFFLFKKRTKPNKKNPKMKKKAQASTLYTSSPQSLLPSLLSIFPPSQHLH